MNKVFLGILLLSLIAWSSYAGGDEYISKESKLDLFIRFEIDHLDKETRVAHQQTYEILIDRLRDKHSRAKSDAQFMRYLFYHVHRKMLGEYEQYVSFGELFTKQQKYDCVTGTSLYALILDDLGIDYEIHETDYHVYLVARSQGREYLFESTDALGGFAWDPMEIAERKAFVNEESIRINATLSMAGLASDEVEKQQARYMDNVVTLHQLAGLQLYNQALKHFNNASYREAFKMIILAQGIYPSTRIKTASSFMFSAAFED